MSKRVLLRKTDISRLFNVSYSAVYRWRDRGQFPPPDVIIGKTEFWYQDKLEKWYPKERKLHRSSWGVGRIQAPRSRPDNGTVDQSIQVNPIMWEELTQLLKDLDEFYCQWF